jgi:hypothetical protein
MKEILSQSSFALGRSPELSPRSPVNVCINNIHPTEGQGNSWGNPFFNFFTPINDFYMAMLAANLSLKQKTVPQKRKKQKKNKIMIISSPGSNAGISSFLKMIELGQIPKDLLFENEHWEEDKLHLSDLLSVPPPLKNIFSKAYIEEIVEKQAIWDVIMDPYKPSFKNSNSIVKKYLNKEDYIEMTPEEIAADKEKVKEMNQFKELFDRRKTTRELSYAEKSEELEYLYQCLFIEYQKLFFKMVQKGKKELESSFYREALRQI